MDKAQLRPIALAEGFGFEDREMKELSAAAAGSDNQRYRKLDDAGRTSETNARSNGGGNVPRSALFCLLVA